MPGSYETALKIIMNEVIKVCCGYKYFYSENNVQFEDFFYVFENFV